MLFTDLSSDRIVKALMKVGFKIIGLIDEQFKELI